MYSKLKNIIKIIDSYPEFTSRLNNFECINYEDIEQIHSDWKNIFKKLDHPIDKAFFKESMLPINKLELNYFIDFSDENYSLFDLQYFSFEPHQWYRVDVFENAQEFILKLNSKPSFVSEINLKENFEIKKAELITERNRLGLEGKLNLRKIDLDFVFKGEINYYFGESKNDFILDGVSPISICLLPHDLEIEEVEIKSRIENYFDMIYEDLNNKSKLTTKVKTIKSLIFLVQSQGASFFSSFYLTFRNSTYVSVKFENNILYINSQNSSDFEQIILSIKELEP